MASWNKVPGYVSAPRPEKSAFKRLFVLGGVLLLAARYSARFINDDNYATIVTVAAYTAATIVGVMALQLVLALEECKPIWEALGDKQRKLIGMGPSATARVPLAPPLPGQARAPELVVTPPSKTVRPMLQPIIIGEEPLGGQLHTPGSRGSARNVTPDQLQRMMLELDQHVDAAAQTAMGGPGEYGAAFPGGAGVQPGVPSLSPASTYRPSAQPRGISAAPIRSDGRVTQSGPAQRAAVMRELGVTEEALETGIESLREWFASDVLQPLQAAFEQAHADVIAGAAQLGFAGVRLTPLTELGTQSAARAAADDNQTIAQIRGRIDEYMRYPANQNSPELRKCIQATVKYQKLLLLLRGEFPSALLPPTPYGYILNRVTELANGSCLYDFNWDSGGKWNGKPWSNELPTDSALLLYLLAAFLAAPHWIFTEEQDPSRIESPNGLLYLGGKIPPRATSESYLAIIPTRPPQGSKATGILALQLGTQQPHFCLLREGENLLTETGQGALFCITVLFLFYCKQHGNAVGGRSLDYLNLGPAVASRASHFRRFRKVFKMW